jgi:hypothetical protein
MYQSEYGLKSDNAPASGATGADASVKSLQGELGGAVSLMYRSECGLKSANGAIPA